MIIFENVDQLLIIENEGELTQVQYDLPAHEKCTAHTLNLVVSTDIDQYLSTSSVSRNLHRSSLAKCPAECNKVSRSTVASDST